MVRHTAGPADGVPLVERNIVYTDLEGGERSVSVWVGAQAGAPGTTWNYSYSATGQLAEISPPAGNVRRFTYDSLDRPTGVTWVGPRPAGQGAPATQQQTVSWSGPIATYTQRDVDGPNLHVGRTVRHDGRGRVARVNWTRTLRGTDDEDFAGDLVQRTFTYDSSDRTRRIDETFTGGAALRTSRYEYDLTGRMTERFEDGHTIDYSYTADGRSWTVAPGLGAAITRTTDGIGRLTSVRVGDAAPYQLSWFPRGDLRRIEGHGLIQERFLDRGRLDLIELTSDGTTRTLDYEWEIEQPSIGVPGQGDAWLTVIANHTDAEEEQHQEISRYWLDGQGRLKVSEEPPVPGAAGVRHTYVWREDSVRLEDIAEPHDVPCVDTDEDGVGDSCNAGLQCIEGACVFPCANDSECADGDKCTNRGGVTVCERKLLRTRHEYGAFDQLSAIHKEVSDNDGGWLPDNNFLQVETDGFGRVETYQSAGQHRTMAWDAEGRMLAMDHQDLDGNALGSSTYTYNWLDQRLSRSASGAPLSYVWEAGGLLAEDTGAGERTFLRGAGLTLGVVGEGAVGFGHDHLGSPVMRGGQVQRYDAWGRFRGGVVPGVGDVSVAYTGHAYDAESGLTYAEARYYDPELGAFLGPDPWSGDLSLPGSLGKFTYVAGNPVGFVDPDGRRRRDYMAKKQAEREARIRAHESAVYDAIDPRCGLSRHCTQYAFSVFLDESEFSADDVEHRTRAWMDFEFGPEWHRTDILVRASMGRGMNVASIQGAQNLGSFIRFSVYAAGGAGMGALTGVEGIVAHLAPWAAEIATASVDASLRLSAVDDTSPQAAAQRRAVWSEFWWATGLGTAGTGIGFGLRGGTPRLKPEDRVPAAPTWADRGAIPEVNVALPTHLRIGPPDDAPFFDLEEAWMERGSRRPRSYA